MIKGLHRILLWGLLIIDYSLREDSDSVRNCTAHSLVALAYSASHLYKIPFTITEHPRTFKVSLEYRRLC